MTTANPKPLGLIMNMIEEMGLEVTYAYDDLVFVAHSAILLQMSEEPHVVNFYFNQVSEILLRESLEKKLVDHGKTNGLTIVYKGIFTLEQLEGEELKVSFLK